MPGVCPLCNNLIAINRRCPCGAVMKDAGPVSDYFGPYSAYFSTDFTAPYCTHLFACPVCGRDRRISMHPE
ncbi:hypothetical protein [Desulfotomaculum copahuensis]|uniref:Uncharacterized protein n=1 Tax=Desulfotomaculum copahuensis TaxID=1838280 RepID=A0A1B7LDU4_9FIRM|nr:hypothetical protein [Desulfotomaculum copahuensis]OAT81260.1 hypothetical protein A6M21_00225 [Desulfotomaculum copahuensis]